MTEQEFLALEPRERDAVVARGWEKPVRQLEISPILFWALWLGFLFASMLNYITV